MLPRHHPSRCAASTCDYTYAASAPTLQLPLLLSATDLDSLLHAGVPREVGAIVSIVRVTREMGALLAAVVWYSHSK